MWANIPRMVQLHGASRWCCKDKQQGLWWKHHADSWDVCSLLSANFFFKNHVVYCDACIMHCISLATRPRTIAKCNYVTSFAKHVDNKAIPNFPMNPLTLFLQQQQKKHGENRLKNDSTEISCMLGPTVWEFPSRFNRGFLLPRLAGSQFIMEIRPH